MSACDMRGLLSNIVPGSLRSPGLRLLIEFDQLTSKLIAKRWRRSRLSHRSTGERAARTRRTCYWVPPQLPHQGPNEAGL